MQSENILFRRKLIAECRKLDPMRFRDTDALSDDEVADDEDDTLTPEQRKAMKEQARKDREQAALLRGQAPTKRAWREAEHEEEKNKRRKVESTQMGQHSQAWDHTKAQKPVVQLSSSSKKRQKPSSLSWSMKPDYNSQLSNVRRQYISPLLWRLRGLCYLSLG